MSVDDELRVSTDYLGQVLALDPRVGLREILVARARRRGRIGSGMALGMQDAEGQGAELAKVERRFWGQPAEVAAGLVAALGEQARPDLERRRSRLAQLVAQRSAIDAALSAPGVSPSFARLFRWSLIDAPQMQAWFTRVYLERLRSRPTTMGLLHTSARLRRRDRAVWNLGRPWLARLRADARWSFGHSSVLWSCGRPKPIALWTAVDRLAVASLLCAAGWVALVLLAS